MYHWFVQNVAAKTYVSPSQVLKDLFTTQSSIDPSMTTLGWYLNQMSPQRALPVAWVNVQLPRTLAGEAAVADRMYPAAAYMIDQRRVDQLHAELLAEGKFEQIKRKQRWIALSDVMDGMDSLLASEGVQNAGQPIYFAIARSQVIACAMRNSSYFTRGELVLISRDPTGRRYLLEYRALANPIDVEDRFGTPEFRHFWIDHWLRRNGYGKLGVYLGIDDHVSRILRSADGGKAAPVGRIWAGFGRRFRPFHIALLGSVGGIFFDDRVRDIIREANPYHRDQQISEALRFYLKRFDENKSQFTWYSWQDRAVHDDVGGRQTRDLNDFVATSNGSRARASKTELFTAEAGKALLQWNSNDTLKWMERGGRRIPWRAFRAMARKLGFADQMEIKSEIEDDAEICLPIAPGLPFILALKQLVAAIEGPPSLRIKRYSNRADSRHIYELSITIPGFNWQKATLRGTDGVEHDLSEHVKAFVCCRLSMVSERGPFGALAKGTGKIECVTWRIVSSGLVFLWFEDTGRSGDLPVRGFDKSGSILVEQWPFVGRTPLATMLQDEEELRAFLSGGKSRLAICHVASDPELAARISNMVAQGNTCLFVSSAGGIGMPGAAMNGGGGRVLYLRPSTEMLSHHEWTRILVEIAGGMVSDAEGFFNDPHEQVVAT